MAPVVRLLQIVGKFNNPIKLRMPLESIVAHDTIPGEGEFHYGHGTCVPQLAYAPSTWKRLRVQLEWGSNPLT